MGKLIKLATYKMEGDLTVNVDSKLTPKEHEDLLKKYPKLEKYAYNSEGANPSVEVSSKPKVVKPRKPRNTKANEQK